MGKWLAYRRLHQASGRRLLVHSETPFLNAPPAAPDRFWPPRRSKP